MSRTTVALNEADQELLDEAVRVAFGEVFVERKGWKPKIELVCLELIKMKKQEEEEKKKKD
jgi:hypothetical protein